MTITPQPWPGRLLLLLSDHPLGLLPDCSLAMRKTFQGDFLRDKTFSRILSTNRTSLSLLPRMFFPSGQRDQYQQSMEHLRVK